MERVRGQGYSNVWETRRRDVAEGYLSIIKTMEPGESESTSCSDIKKESPCAVGVKERGERVNGRGSRLMPRLETVGVRCLDVCHGHSSAKL